MIRFERLGPNEGARLRSLRLRALRDAPHAFSTTYEDALTWIPDVWTKRAIDMPTFVGVGDSGDVAMVRCRRDTDQTDRAWLLSMWVAPEVRRQKVGDRLVDLVVAWARTNNVSRVLLDVADLNVPAVSLYEAKGFMRNGNAGTFPPPREHIREHQRELRVA